MKPSFEEIAQIIWGKTWEMNAGHPMPGHRKILFMDLISELRSEGHLTPRPVHIKLLLEAFSYDASDWTKPRLKTICKKIGNLPEF